MKHLSQLGCAVVSAALLALLPLAAQAQGMVAGSPQRLLPGASLPASEPAGHDAPKRLWCADNDDPGFRRSMAQCTALVDRAARQACVDHVMEARRDEAARVAFPIGGGFVGGAGSPEAVASLERRAVSRDCVY